MIRRILYACMCAWFAGVADPAEAFAAQSLSPQSAISFEQCASLDEPATRKLLALELRAVAEAKTAQVRVRCEGAQVFLNVASGDRQSSRELFLGATHVRAWPRIVALAAIELLTEPLIPPPVSAPAASAEVGTASAKATVVRQDDDTFRVATIYDLGIVARTLPSLRSTSFGLGAGAVVLLRTTTSMGRVGIRVGASVEHATQTLDAGKGVVNAGSLFLGGVAVSRRPLAPWLAVGVRGGMAWLRGEPSMVADGLAFSAPWLGPEVAVGVSYLARSGLGIAAHAEGGYAVVAAVGRGAAVNSERFGYSGTWLALNLSLALQP